ncbi:unnamed protein product, partial [Iphiclides podalirius]
MHQTVSSDRIVDCDPIASQLAPCVRPFEVITTEQSTWEIIQSKQWLRCDAMIVAADRDATLFEDSNIIRDRISNARTTSSVSANGTCPADAGLTIVRSDCLSTRPIRVRKSFNYRNYVREFIVGVTMPIVSATPTVWDTYLAGALSRFSARVATLQRSDLSRPRLTSKWQVSHLARYFRPPDNTDLF